MAINSSSSSSSSIIWLIFLFNLIVANEMSEPMVFQVNITRLLGLDVIDSLHFIMAVRQIQFSKFADTTNYSDTEQNLTTTEAPFVWD